MLKEADQTETNLSSNTRRHFMRVLGAAWVALIAIITPWLTQYFGNTTWVEAAVIGLGPLS